MSQNTFDFYWTQKAIDLLIKMAGVVVTSFATLAVAHEAFDYITQPWLDIIKIGALILVEGAFIISWLAIDSQKSAPMQMKLAWAITLVVVYLALLVIALEHGEGAAGWAFRFVLAVMIGRSIYEAGIYEVLKQNRRADRDINSNFKVRRISRQIAQQNAIIALNMESTQSNYALDLGQEVARAKVEAEHEANLIEVNLLRKRLLEKIHQKDNLSRKQFQVKMLMEKDEVTQQIEAAKEPTLLNQARMRR